MYTEIRLITLGDKKWTKITRIKSKKKQMQELGKFVKGIIKLRAFCLRQYRNQRTSRTGTKYQRLAQKHGILNKETYNRIQHYSIETCVQAYVLFFEDKS
jgi:hypothetical protein